jgi:hypothetical protein
MGNKNIETMEQNMTAKGTTLLQRNKSNLNIERTVEYGEQK